MKIRILTAGILLCGILFTGCGSAPMDEAMTSAESIKYSYAADYADMEAEAEEISVGSVNKASGTIAQNSGSTVTAAENDLAERKLIRDANLSVETKTYDDFITALEQQIAGTGGYVQSGENSGSAERGNRWAYYTVRVPESAYNGFLRTVSDLGNVTYKSENVRDVTMEYTDVEAKIRALETEYETLLGILEKCEKLEDVITVQSRITEVGYELDSYKSRIRQYDNLISYCTIYLSVNEVERETIPAAEKTVGQRIAEELADNCEDIADDAKNFAVWFVSSLPYFGIWIVVLGGIVILTLVLGRRSHRKLKERRAERQDQNENTDGQ